MADPAEIAFRRLLLGGIGLMLVVGGALLVFVIAYQKRLLQQRLRLQAVEAFHQQQLLVAIVGAQEGERERIGQDLHDGIGSVLATAKLLAGRLGHLSPAENPAELFTLLQTLLGTAVQDVRSIAHSLYPAVLARYGLAEALAHLVDVSNEAGVLPVSLAVAYERPLPLAQELALYRVCQELIHNSLKHAAGASQLTVQLQQQGPLLRLAVADDGTGFPVPAPGAVPPGSGAGLRSIALRVEVLGARLHQHSAPGRGTRTVIELDTPA